MTQLGIDLSMHPRVTVIGLGGIGSVVARYLSLFLDNLPTTHELVLVDGDNYEPQNIDRQFFSQFGNKAEVSAESIEEVCNRTVVTPVAEFIGEENYRDVIQEGGLVFACVDHHGVRRFIAEKCRELQNVVLISGGNDGVEGEQRGTLGNIQVNVRKDGEDITPSILHNHPEIAGADMSNAPLGKQGCGMIIPSVPQILFANVMAASCMLNCLLCYATQNLRYRELWFDIVDATMTPYSVAKKQLVNS